MQNKEVEDLLRRSVVEIAPEMFYLVSLTNENWLKLLENPALSPRMTAPFMILKDKFETTLLVDEIDFKNLQSGLAEAKTEGGFRLLTFDLAMDFGVVGFLAEVTRILAAARIPVLALSAFSRDHILVKQDDLAAALKVLGPHVEDLC